MSDHDGFWERLEADADESGEEFLADGEIGLVPKPGPSRAEVEAQELRHHLSRIALALAPPDEPIESIDYYQLYPMVEALVADRARLREKVEAWAGDGAEYRHALEHVVDCSDGCLQCRDLAFATLERTTMGKPTGA